MNKTCGTTSAVRRGRWAANSFAASPPHANPLPHQVLRSDDYALEAITAQHVTGESEHFLSVFIMSPASPTLGRERKVRSFQLPSVRRTMVRRVTASDASSLSAQLGTLRDFRIRGVPIP